MRGTDERKSYHHGDLRKALVDASRMLVEEKGSAHFSVAQAARAAGVSSAAPYRHFKDRDELLDAVAEAGLASLDARFAEAAAPFPSGSIDALSAIGQAYVAFAQAEPAVFRLMFAQPHKDSTSPYAAGQRCKTHLLTQVAAYMGHDEVGPDTLAAALPLWMLVHGLSFAMIDGKLADDGMDAIPIGPMLRDCTERLLRR